MADCISTSGKRPRCKVGANPRLAEMLRELDREDCRNQIRLSRGQYTVYDHRGLLILSTHDQHTAVLVFEHRSQVDRLDR
jgi:hypothetical protein